MITAWRIVRGGTVEDAFSGEGASAHPGRWNLRGTRVVYTAQSAALAALEMLVHLDSERDLESYVLFACSFSKEMVEVLDRANLPPNWKDDPAPPALRQLGDEWLRASSTTVLQVPSVIIPSESNFLLNPAHSAFGRIAIADPVPFSLDLRLLRR